MTTKPENNTYPAPSKGEFTKITTSDGKLAYVAKTLPNHDETVARITEEWSKEDKVEDHAPDESFLSYDFSEE